MPSMNAGKISNSSIYEEFLLILRPSLERWESTQGENLQLSSGLVSVKPDLLLSLSLFVDLEHANGSEVRLHVLLCHSLGQTRHIDLVCEPKTSDQPLAGYIRL